MKWHEHGENEDIGEEVLILFGLYLEPHLINMHDCVRVGRIQTGVAQHHNHHHLERDFTDLAPDPEAPLPSVERGPDNSEELG